MNCEILDKLSGKHVNRKTFEDLIVIKVMAKLLAKTMQDSDEQRCYACIAERSSQLIDEILKEQKIIF